MASITTAYGTSVLQPAAEAIGSPTPPYSTAPSYSTGTAQASAASTASSDSDSSSSDAGIITSSDFLTLLVTELKNQDPTSTQDPNAYIDQLVQVNSLQQLISINQELAPSTTTTTTSPSTNGQTIAMGDQNASVKR